MVVGCPVSDLHPREPCLCSQHDSLPPVLLPIREAQHCSLRGVLEAMSSVLCFPGILSCDGELPHSMACGIVRQALSPCQRFTAPQILLSLPTTL